MDPLFRLTEAQLRRLLAGGFLLIGIAIALLHHDPVTAFKVGGGLLTLFSVVLVVVARRAGPDDGAVRLLMARDARITEAAARRKAGQARRTLLLRAAEMTGYTAAAFWIASLAAQCVLQVVE